MHISKFPVDDGEVYISLEHITLVVPVSAQSCMVHVSGGAKVGVNLPAMKFVALVKEG